jgi:hypothetical protein
LLNSPRERNERSVEDTKGKVHPNSAALGMRLLSCLKIRNFYQRFLRSFPLYPAGGQLPKSRNYRLLAWIGAKVYRTGLNLLVSISSDYNIDLFQ